MKTTNQMPWKTESEQIMKANHKQKILTFGKLIEAVYGVCGNRRAKGIISLAVEAHVVVFREQRPFPIY